MEAKGKDDTLMKIVSRIIIWIQSLKHSVFGGEPALNVLFCSVEDNDLSLFAS